MKNQIAIITAIILFNLLFQIKVVHAATITASGCTQPAVQASVNSAATGDIVSVPAGNCSWSGGVSIPNTKKITLLGAGMNSTVITGGSLLLGQSGSRITAFGFVNAQIDADGNDFRIDHCSVFFGNWSDGIRIISRNTNPPVITTGLIDHNTLTNMRVLVNGTNYMMSEGNEQHQLWTYPLDLGGPSAVYIEDNTFVPGPGSVNAVDGNYGGRFVFRYNTLNGLQVEAHSSQEETNRAIRKWEVYGNILNNTGASIYYPFRLRGGTGVVFYNSVPGTWSNDGIALDNVRSYSAASAGGLCNGGSSWDGNQNATGYPCRDQIGRSADNPIWVPPSGAYTQPLVPVYGWLNKNENNANVPFAVINSSDNHIKANRDYYDYNANFNGSSGVGCGTLAARPATCSAEAGYWATDQSCSSLAGMVGASPATPLSGTLYVCASASWKEYYKPYTYPHPLQSGGPVIEQLAPPSGLQGQPI